MGLEDAIQRAEAQSASHASRFEAKKAKVLSDCQEFMALVKKHRVSPSGPLFTLDFQRGGETDSIVYSLGYVGRYWLVYSDTDGHRDYALNEDAKPISIGFIQDHHFFDTSMLRNRSTRVSDSFIFDDATWKAHGSNYQPASVAILKSEDYDFPGMTINLSENRLASAFQDLRNRS